MRVFVTGASGHIGSAVVGDLLAAGHQVVGLARSDASARTLTAAGAEVVRGDLDDLAARRAAARPPDGVISLAFNHELAFHAGRPDGFFAASAQEVRAVQARSRRAPLLHGVIRRDDVGAVRVVGDQRRAHRLLGDVALDQPVAQHAGVV
jgi:nucleoside-diphosphate-sugar epimerase